MFNLRIFTQGLPDGTHRKQRYEFHFVGDYVYIPGNYVGRDQIGDPHFPEQEKYLNSLHKEGIEPVWSGEWKCTPAATQKLLLKLQAIENFRGVYEMVYYHRNDNPSTVFLLSIGSESPIQKINIQETHYHIVTQEEEDSTEREYAIERHFYNNETGVLTLYALDNNQKKVVFEVNLEDNTFNIISS